MSDNVMCDDCGKEVVVEPGSVGTGYATRVEGPKVLYVCYACMAKRDLATIREGKPIGLYLSRRTTDGKERVTEAQASYGQVKSFRWFLGNWCDTLRFPAHAKEGHHNWGGTRRDVWFTDPQGFEWYGRCIGKWNEHVIMRRTKVRSMPKWMTERIPVANRGEH